MVNETSAKLDNGVDVQIDVDKEVPTKKVFTLAEITAMKERKKAQDKEVKKLAKDEAKAKEDAETFSDANVKKMNEEAIKIEQDAALILFNEVTATDDELVKGHARVKTMTDEVIVQKRQVHDVKRILGLHKNSPKNLADSPYKHAIPKSIVENTKLCYPGVFIETFVDGRSVELKSVKSRIVIDYRDPIRCHVHHGYGQAKRSTSFTYGQGIKRNLEAWLASCQPKKA